MYNQIYMLLKIFQKRQTDYLRKKKKTGSSKGYLKTHTTPFSSVISHVISLAILWTWNINSVQ